MGKIEATGAPATAAERALGAFVGVVFVVVVVALFAAFFPGAHSVDTLVQIREGLSGDYTAGHPPLLSWMLGAAVHAAGSPWPVLALQLFAFAFAYAAVAVAARSPWSAALLLVVFVLPPTWGVAITLWKDIWLATGVCVVAVGLLLVRPRWRVACFVVGAVGACLFRHNAIVVVGPMALAGLALTAGYGRRLRAALGVALVVGMIGAPRVVASALDTRPLWGLGPTAAWDLCHFYKRDAKAYRHSPFRDISRRRWKKACLADGAKRIINNRRGLPGFHWRGQLTENKAKVEREWLRLVRRDPAAYLAIRAADMRRFLGADDAPISGAIAGPWRAKKLFTPTDTTTVAYQRADAARRWAADTPLQRPLTWVVLLLVLSLVAVVRRARPALAVAAGLWIHLASLFFVMPATGFRYAHVVVVGDAVVAVLLLARPRGLSAPAPTGSSTAAASG
jgi:hypothetical protein